VKARINACGEGLRTGDVLHPSFFYWRCLLPAANRYRAFFAELRGPQQTAALTLLNTGIGCSSPAFCLMAVAWCGMVYWHW